MNLNMNTVRWADLEPQQQTRLLQRPVFDNPGLQEAVAGIIRRVREGGDGSLRALTAELDGLSNHELLAELGEQLAVAQAELADLEAAWLDLAEQAES